MNATEYKQIEGERIQKVLGAIGALPAAMLVFGDGPAVSASGAPLFAAGIALIVGALMHWSYTDAAYHMDCNSHDLAPGHKDQVKLWIIKLHASGYHFQRMTYAYAIGSLMCSLLGVAGVYSTLRSGIDVNLGFGLAVAIASATCVEVAMSGQRRNRLVSESRRLSELPEPE